MTRTIESYVEDIAGTTTTSTSSTNVAVSTTHTGVASTQYMIFGYIRLNKNSITTDYKVNFNNTTSGATYQSVTVELKDDTDYVTLQCLGLYTAAATPVSNTIELNVFNETSGTITWSHACIFLVKVDSTDGIGESTGDTAVDQGDGAVDKMSVSLSVASDGRYAIFYSVEARTGDSDFPPASVRVDIDGTDYCIRRFTSKDTTTRMVLHGAFPVDLTAGTRDIDLELAAHGGSIDIVTFGRARLFALRMSTFDDVHDVFVTAADTNDVNDTYEDVPGASLTVTLPAVDHLVIASCSMAMDITTQSYLGKFQQSIGGSNSDWITWTQEAQASTELLPFTTGYRLEATAVEHIWKFRHAPEATGICSTDDAAIIVFQVEAGVTAYTLTAATVAYSISGAATALKKGSLISAASGTYTLSGTAATLRYARSIIAGSGSYAISGTAASVVATRKLVAATVAYAINGTAVTLLGAHKIVAATVAYTINGTATTLSLARKLIAATVAYTINGTAAALKSTRILGAASGTYAINGTAAALNFSKTLVAGAGSYVISGTAAGVRATRKITAAAGSYAINGTATTLSLARKIIAIVGSYAINGTATTLRATRKITAAAGSYILSGTNATLISPAKILIAGSVAYTIAGTTATLTFVGGGVALIANYIPILRRRRRMRGRR